MWILQSSDGYEWIEEGTHEAFSDACRAFNEMCDRIRRDEIGAIDCRLVNVVLEYKV